MEATDAREELNHLVRLARNGTVDMEPSPLDVAEVVDAVLFEQRDLLRERGVRVNVRQPLPAVWCNEGRLKQIVTNLVRNAAYHGCDRRQPKLTILPAETPPTGVPLEAPPAEFPLQTLPALAAFAIHDNGPGIERAMQEVIFLPGRRLPTADAEGTGMGLAIVRKIVDYYGGTAYVDPDCREGTTFVVALPMAEPGRSSDVKHRRWKLELDAHRQRGHAAFSRAESARRRAVGRAKP